MVNSNWWFLFQNKALDFVLQMVIFKNNSVKIIGVFMSVCWYGHRFVRLLIKHRVGVIFLFPFQTVCNPGRCGFQQKAFLPQDTKNPNKQKKPKCPRMIHCLWRVLPQERGWVFSNLVMLGKQNISCVLWQHVGQLMADTAAMLIYQHRILLEAEGGPKEHRKLQAKILYQLLQDIGLFVLYTGHKCYLCHNRIKC